MTEERWTKFLKAIVHIMPQDTIDDMWEYAMLRPAHKKSMEGCKGCEDPAAHSRTHCQHEGNDEFLADFMKDHSA
eukprot:3261885-Karenia_brevis.AAC.1